ncbi:uncharacterized protein FIBRA_04780 [Fibroporia radiculosa]|uniref:SWI5-dependent HO expression protein 3 n=1 Tax=Fibroporia radiculosa TaxID=599839 RepID=J4GPT2_9APHY|nr:uncharacterized protein FIBRA_04780 [Fibroporia radiculosa]CCM02675.1 predicted protein [Fibroporia radiculosa]
MSSSSLLTYPFSPPRPNSRPSSRSSVRSSGRSASPVVTLSDDTVALRHQMSTLKHSIRHQQAQLQSLENQILRGPRPLPPGIMNSPPLSPTAELDQPPPTSPPTAFSPRMQKRNSFEILHSLAGPDSNLPLPLPKREDRRLSFGEENGIREGIPTSSGHRPPSPTRTLSRIPVSSVGNARALAEEGQQDSSYATSSLSTSLSASTSTLSPATSPNRRSSFAPGNTTKVLADLQAGVLNAKNALENTKAQLRLSQRQVSQLTRQTEDLKEVRERLRLENEGLNNVVARKERLLQEVLERARKAEAEVITLKSQLKLETTNSKKSLREMDSSLVEATARSQKAEREYIVLRDSLKGLAASFQADTDSLRNEMRKREEKVLREAEDMGKKYSTLVEEVRKEREDGGAGMGEVKRLRDEREQIRKEIEDSFREDIGQLRVEVEKAGRESEEAWQTAKSLAEELGRLRRLMRTAGDPPPVSLDALPPP